MRVEVRFMAVSRLSDADRLERFALWRAYPGTHGPATVPKSKRLLPVYRKEPHLDQSRAG